jgi:hypothetical protein
MEIILPNKRVKPTWPSAWCLRWYILRWKSKYNEPMLAQLAKRLTRQSLGSFIEVTIMEKENIFIRLRDYFQNIAISLDDEKRTSNIFPNPSDKGATREDILIEFLIHHLPKRCEAIKGGFIFDSLGNESNQIDLLVINDLTLQFNQFESNVTQGKSFNCIEGCYCAISVKSSLDKKELEDSLLNISSIPQMPNLEDKINPFISGKEKVQDFPFKIVFSFSGPSYDTTMQNMMEFYDHHEIPENRRPDMIIVNNKYFIIHIGNKGFTLADGTNLPPFTYCPVISEYIGSYSLMFMLTHIQKASVFGSNILIDFEKYVNKIKF